MAFIDLQNWRHLADYDPNAVFTRYDAVTLINRAEDAIRGFVDADAMERRAFAAHVLFRARISY